MSGGRGPKSICLRTWSIARSPLNAVTTVSGDGVAGRELVEMLAFGLGGGLSLGQAEKGSGIANAVASRTMRFPPPDRLLIVISSLLFLLALRVRGP